MMFQLKMESSSLLTDLMDSRWEEVDASVCQGFALSIFVVTLSVSILEMSSSFRLRFSTLYPPHLSHHVSEF